MARQHATAFVVLVLALLTVPAAFAATQGSLSTILQPLQDLLGQNGLGALYTQAPLFFDSIFALMIFVGLAMKTVGERLGKPAAIALGLMLSIAYVLGAAKYNFHLADLAPLALVLMFGILAYLSYALLQPLIENRLLAFAFSFMVIGGMLYTLMPQLPKDYPDQFFWVGLLLAISTIVSIFAIIRMVGRGVSGGGSGSGWGFGSGGLGWGGGRANTIDYGLDKAAASFSDTWNDRKEKARAIAAQVRTQFLGSFKTDVEKLNEAKELSTALRANVEQLTAYLGSVETNVDASRVLGTNGAIAMRTYKQEVAGQMPQIDQYFTQQNTFAQKFADAVSVHSMDEKRADAIGKAETELRDARTKKLKKLTEQVTLFKTIKGVTDNKATTLASDIASLKRKADKIRAEETQLNEEMGEQQAELLRSTYVTEYQPVLQQELAVLDAEVSAFKKKLADIEAEKQTADAAMDAVKKALKSRDIQTIPTSLLGEIQTMQGYIRTYLTTLDKKQYTQAVASANIIIGNLQQFEEHEPQFAQAIENLATIVVKTQAVEEEINKFTDESVKDTSPLAKAYYGCANALHESVSVLSGSELCKDFGMNTAKAVEELTAAKVSKSGDFDKAKKKALASMSRAANDIKSLVTQTQTKANALIATHVGTNTLPGKPANTLIADAERTLSTLYAKIQANISTITKIDELKAI